MKQVIVAITLLCFCSSVFALRCGNRLILPGDPKVKVKRYCGKPVDVTRYSDTSAHRNQYGGYTRSAGKPIEQWTYNFGPQKFLYVLTIENNRVGNIEANGYGF